MEILFLGTSAAVPSRYRSTSCIAVREGRDIVLLDCGEGAQRQLMVSPFSFMKVRAVLITHLHGDHVFGLPGLLQTMGLSGRTDPLLVCGPPGTAGFIGSCMSYTEGEAGYPLEIRELEGGEEISAGAFSASCFRTDHGISSLGYVVRGPAYPGRLDHAKALALGVRDGPDMARLKAGEAVGGVTPEMVVGSPSPGTAVAYTGDTKASSSIAEAVRGADVLVHEATYSASDAASAAEHNHSTSVQAAETAAAASVRCLIMTHISHRYDDRSVLEAEAREVFPESYAADDMDMFVVGRGSVRRESVRQA